MSSTEASIREELEKVNLEISNLERCKRVLQETLASEVRKGWETF